jgi:hypothetical protein
LFEYISAIECHNPEPFHNGDDLLSGTRRKWHHLNSFAQYLQHHLLPEPADSALRDPQRLVGGPFRCSFIIAGSSTDRLPRSVSLMVIFNHVIAKRLCLALL